MVTKSKVVTRPGLLKHRPNPWHDLVYSMDPVPDLPPKKQTSETVALTPVLSTCRMLFQSPSQQRQTTER